jgi:hypothetical protein
MLKRSEEEKAERRAEYRRYLKGRIWQAIRGAALYRAGHKCEWCQGTERLQVHHKKYPDVLGTETPEMLQVLCDPCHAERHGQPYLVTKQDATQRAERGARLREYRSEEKQAVRGLRKAARMARRAARKKGKRAKPTPSNAQLLARVERGERPKRQRRVCPDIDTSSLKDRY